MNNYWHTESQATAAAAAAASSATHANANEMKCKARHDKEMRRKCDEIRKLHDIKLNLISTWSPIDYYHFIFMCDRTFPSFVFFFISDLYKVFVHVFVVKCQWKKRKLLLSISHLHKYYKWIWPFNAIISTISAYPSNQVNSLSHTLAHTFYFTLGNRPLSF